MATGALFIGWGVAVRGREQQALQVFGEAMQYYAQLQQQGTIESFEPVILEAHGGDLSGFVLIRGDRGKLNTLRTSEEFLRLSRRAGFLVDKLGVINAFIGEELQRLTAISQTLIAELNQSTR